MSCSEVVVPTAKDDHGGSSRAHHKPPSRKPPPSSQMGCGGARLQIRGCPHLTDAIMPSLPATRMSRQHRHKYSTRPVLDVGRLPPPPCHPRIAALPPHWQYSVPSHTVITCIVTGSPRSPRYLILATAAYWCTCRLGWRAMHVSNSARNLVLLARTQPAMAHRRCLLCFRFLLQSPARPADGRKPSKIVLQPFDDRLLPGTGSWHDHHGQLRSTALTATTAEFQKPAALPSIRSIPTTLFRRFQPSRSSPARLCFTIKIPMSFRCKSQPAI